MCQRRGDGSVEGMLGRNLPVAAGEHEQQRQRADPAREQRDNVERRLVRPVHVLEREHRGARRQRQLVEQEPVDLVRRCSGRECIFEGRRQRADEIVDRAERPRDREVVAAPDERPRARLEPGDELRQERRLADSRLSGHDHDTPLSARRRRPSLRQLGE